MCSSVSAWLKMDMFSIEGVNCHFHIHILKHQQRRKASGWITFLYSLLSYLTFPQLFLLISVVSNSNFKTLLDGRWINKGDAYDFMYVCYIYLHVDRRILFNTSSFFFLLMVHNDICQNHNSEEILAICPYQI